MEKLNRMLRSFFWFAVLPPIIMLLFIMYYGTNHIFGLTAFVVICVASACANAYRIRMEIKRIKDSL